MEFGIDRKTLTKRLSMADAQPDGEGQYSTRQICSAIFGDLHGERTRLAKEQADKIALENATTRRELISVADAIALTNRFCFAIRQRFLASNLADEEKNSLLRDIQSMTEIDFTELPESNDEENGSN